MKGNGISRLDKNYLKYVKSCFQVTVLVLQAFTIGPCRFVMAEQINTMSLAYRSIGIEMTCDKNRNCLRRRITLSTCILTLATFFSFFTSVDVI